MGTTDKGSGRLVSQAELAMIMGCNTLTIKAWVNKGMPCVKKSTGPGKVSQYNTADCIRWREKLMAQQALGDNRSMEMDEAKRRKAAAEAASAEIDLEVKRGALVSVDEVGAVVETEYSTIRANFMAMPGEIAPELEHLTTVEIEERLVNKVTEILGALAAEDQFVSGAFDE